MYLNSNREKLIKYILSVSGIFSVTLSLYLSVSFYFSDFDKFLTFQTHKAYLLILVGLYIVITAFTGLNKSFFKRKIFNETVVVIYYSFFMVCGLILILFWMHRLVDSHRLIVGYYLVIFIATDVILRSLIKFILLKIYFNSKFSSKLLLITDNSKIDSVLKPFKSNLDWSRQLCGLCVLDSQSTDCSGCDSTKFFDSDVNKKAFTDTKLIADKYHVDVVANKDTLLSYITLNNVDEIFVYTKLIYTDTEVQKIISHAEEMGIKVNVRINLDLFDFLPKSSTKIDRIGTYYCVSISRNHLSYRNRMLKHTLDYVGGLVGFILFCLAYCVLGLIIKLDSKGPILFSQNRVGRNGRIFKCYKFRSMRADAEDLKKKLMSQNEMQGLMFKMENDPRITKVGRFIRKTSLDELPQFINVLKGDMSLVGTRPPTVDEYEKYEPKHKARVSMMPGLTGLWQVSGRSDIKDFDEVVKLDMEYIDNASFWFDIKIILLTIKTVIFGRGAK